MWSLKIHIWTAHYPNNRWILWILTFNFFYIVKELLSWPNVPTQIFRCDFWHFYSRICFFLTSRNILYLVQYITSNLSQLKRYKNTDIKHRPIYLPSALKVLRSGRATLPVKKLHSVLRLLCQALAKLYLYFFNSKNFKLNYF